MPQHQQEKEVPKPAKPEVDEVAHETAKIPETLSQLLGRMTEKLLTALHGSVPAVKQQAIQECLREMRIWYDAQPIEDRKELARAARKQLEQFKMVGEQFFQEMMIISAQDVQ
jgi:hypothetical protein